MKGFRRNLKLSAEAFSRDKYCPLGFVAPSLWNPRRFSRPPPLGMFGQTNGERFIIYRKAGLESKIWRHSQYRNIIPCDTAQLWYIRTAPLSLLKKPGEEKDPRIHGKYYSIRRRCRQRPGLDGGKLRNGPISRGNFYNIILLYWIKRKLSRSCWNTNNWYLILSIHRV